MEAKSNGAASRLLRLLAGTCFAWAFVAIATAFALNYGVGLYGAGLYNVGALASTTTTLSSSLNPSTFGSGVTLTAAVTPSTATGTLTFKDGSTTLGTITLGHASGSLTTSALTVGSHALTAVYGGNLAFSGSTSNTLTQTVNLSATFTVLTSSLNPSTYGSGVLLRAAVTPATATGTLTFKDGATTIGSATLGHGSGSLTTSALSAGTHSMTAVYAGNVNYSGSTSNTVTQTVNQAGTVTTLTSTLNPSAYGSGTTLRAVVSPSTATGTLTFKDGSTTIGTVTLGHGSGSMTTSALSAGSHSLTAVYSGNVNYGGSTSNTVTQVVNQATTSTALTSSLNPSTYGSGVTLRAVVSPSTATDTLTFKDGSATIGSVTLGHGSGSLTTSALSAGTHSMTAVYAGNVNYAGGTSNTLSQTVAKAASTTVLVSSLNPSTFGSGVTLTATVSPASATGTLTFKDGATTIGSVTLGHGSGSMTASALAVGSHSLTAVYGGNSNFNTSTSAVVSQAVNSPTGLSSSTTLTSSLNPSTFGSGVTLRVAVTPSSATGSVAFLDHGVTLAVVTLGHGSGSYTTSALPARSHDLTAMYGGNGTYLSSTSNTLTQVVNQAGSTTILASSLNPSTFGSGVWLTASVTPSTATGTVSFKEGATTLGVVTLGHGSGRLLISTPTAGSHPLTAVYAGNVNFLTSTSPVLTQTVTRAASTTTLTSSLNPTTFGSGVTLRAAVSPATATGTVTFQDGSTTIGTTTLGHGSGSVTVSTLSAGSHSLTAVYAGNVNYAASTSNTVTQIVNRAATAVGLVSGTNPSAAGVTVTFTATTISTATGAVTFLDGLVTLGSATLSSGTASYGLSSLAVGSHAVTAVYGGNVNYLSGTSAVLTQVVTAATGGGGGGGGGGGSTTTDSGGGGGTRRSTTQSSSSAAPALQAAADNTSNVLPAQGSKLLVTIDGNQVVFRDVPVDSWYAAFVSELVQAGIVSGYRDAQGQPTGFFGPQNAVTYGESLKMALTAAQKRLSSGVPQNRSARGDWSAPYVKTAEELHLSVYLSALDVRKPAIRGAVIETLLEAFGVTIAPATNPFTDLPSSDPHAAAIETAAALGIVAGDTNASGKPKGTVRPNAPVNRAEVAKIVSLLRKATGR